MDEISILIFILVALLGLVRSSYLHIKAKPSDEYAIKVLPFFSFVLGSYRKEGIIYIPALILQVIVIVMMPMLVLYVLGIVSLLALNICIWFLVLISTLLIVWAKIQNKK